MHTGTPSANGLNDIPPALGAGGCVLLCMLDLSAAFDLVSHDILLIHLQVELGIGGTPIEWFSSCLSQSVAKSVMLYLNH